MKHERVEIYPDIRRDDMGSASARRHDRAGFIPSPNPIRLRIVGARTYALYADVEHNPGFKGIMNKDSSSEEYTYMIFDNLQQGDEHERDR